MYKLFYWMMLIGYFGLTIQALDAKAKIVGILLLLVNAILFW